MPYYQQPSNGDFERQISSFDETRYDVFQTASPPPQFQGVVQPAPNAMPAGFYQQPYQPPQGKSHVGIWIALILALLVFGVVGAVQCSSSMAEMMRPRPTNLEEVHNYNLPANEYNALEYDEEDDPLSNVNVAVPEEPAESQSTEELVAQLTSTPPSAITSYISFPGSRAGYPMPYYRSCLSPTAQIIYDRIVDAMLSLEPEVMYPDGITLSDNEFIVDCVRADHPEIFWVGDTYRYYSYGNEVVSIELEYVMDTAQRDQIAAQIDGSANAIVAEAAGLDGDYAKVRYYYERLAGMISYNYDLDNLTTQTVFGAFVENVTACAGYSRAMQYLCYKSNIPCIYVLGYCAGSDEVPDGPHAWNAMSCDGVSFYTDVTWGDADTKGIQADYTYNFLGLTLADILSTSHSFKYADIMPIADDPRYEEWMLGGSAMGTYSLEDVGDLLVDRFSQGVRTVYLRFPDSGSASAFWNDYTGWESAGGKYMINRAPWLIGDDGYYHHYAIDTGWMNVFVYSWTDG